MNRRAFVTGLGAALAAPFGATAQLTDGQFRVGIIQTTDTPEASGFWQITTDRLRELGYIEGGNVVFIRRSAGGDIKKLPAVAADLVQAKPDVLVTGSPPATAAAADATKVVPIVAIASGHMLAKGWAKTLARPGGNVTGITDLVAEEILAKRFALLKDLVPGLKRVGWLWWPGGGLYQGLPPVAEPARHLNLTVYSLEFRSPAEITASFAAAKRMALEALVVAGDILVFQHKELIAGEALKYRIPSVSSSKAYVEAGGPMAYGVSTPDLFRRAADYVDRILRGTPPSVVPIEQATKFELVINLKTAKTLGLTIAPSLLLRADQVIE